jgi:hypothetical protein
MGNELAWLAQYFAVDQDVGANLVIVEHVARSELEKPVHLASLRVPGNRAVAVEIVSRPIGGIEHRDGIPGSPDGLVCIRVIGAGYPNGSTSRLPSVVVALPSLAAGFAGRGNGADRPRVRSLSLVRTPSVTDLQRGGAAAGAF